MAETISKLIIEIDGKDYEFSGSGGTPGPDTVGTEQIKDDSVILDDLNTEVKAKMTHTYDSENEGIILGGISGNTDN